MGQNDAMQPAEVPKYSDLLWPTLRAVIALGDSGTIDELNAKVLEIEDFSEAQQSILHGDGPGTEIEYRLAWARTSLKRIGTLNNSARGVWAVTAAGRHLDEAAVRKSHAESVAEIGRRRKQERKTDVESDANGGDEDEAHWKEQLLDLLLQLSPDAFERLAQRLLREAGFVSATVLGRSGDGGIDGLGVYRLSLVSFPVFFQCKRYRGSVGAGAVRDFRGAMAGRGDKGLLITTGSFTTDAKAEATRDGATPIDLIDGDRLCDLMAEYRLGVQIETRTIEDIHIDESFFGSI